MAFDSIRRRFMGTRLISPLPESAELECLREIRAEMAASFPRVRVLRIARIIRKFKLRRLPPGLLVQSDTLLSGLFKMFRVQFSNITRATYWHPLFASGPYLLLNPDVASSGLSPWLHYQVFGRMEGRSPHPFIDIKALAASMPGVPVGEVLDEYLSLPEMWTVDPSAYVDCQRFLVSGRWDGRTHPLIQLVTENLAGPWIHQRLMLVDTTGTDSLRSRSLAVAVLIARNGTPVGERGPQLWEQRGDFTATLSETEYTVVPGFFLGAEGVILASTHGQVMSSDGSMVQLDDELISVPAGEVRREQELIYLEGDVSRRELDDVLYQASDGAVIAPSSQQQQHLIEAIVRHRVMPHHVLSFGRQVRVTTTLLRIIPAGRSNVTIADWDGSESLEAQQLAIAIPEGDLAEVLEVTAVGQAVAAGAAICPVHAGQVWTWVPLLDTRDLVVADSSLIPALCGVVDEGHLRRLESNTTGRQL